MRQYKSRRPAAHALNPKRNAGQKPWRSKFVQQSTKPPTAEPEDVSGKRPTKVLIVYRTGFVRSGVLSLIASRKEFVVCGETGEAPFARELFLRHQPDLVLIGFRLGGADGIQLIKEFRSLDPTAAILLLSEHADEFLVQRVFRAGARGYLSIEDAPELLRALNEVLVGRPYVGASVLPLVLKNFAGGTKNSRNTDINSLSDRELEIFSFIGRGLSVSELASELNVSVKTIETHQMRMKEKLALHTAAELRQKARDWLTRCTVNRVHEDPDLE
jgi:DNA-binding NarL/FixJ family response regulator